MIVGCYTLHLYCDDPKHHERYPLKTNSLDAEFVAETGPSCRAQARRKGWRLDSDTGKAYCPSCRRATQTIGR